MVAKLLCRTADFMRTVTDAEDDLQLFWQAFPAEGGAARTTYMFSYADCAKQRPSLQVLSSQHCQTLSIKAILWSRLLLCCCSEFLSC